MLSSSAPHAGHLALSALLNSLRSLLSGMWVSLSWDIRLTDLRERFGALMVLRNLFDRVEVSIWCILLPLTDFRQVFSQLLLS